MTLFDPGFSFVPFDFGTPVSVIDTCAESWRLRSMFWGTLGIDGAEGREAPVLHQATLVPRFSQDSGGKAFGGGTSEFSPVLTELLLGRYSAPGDEVYDPFAGGPTRGAVAATMGRAYMGVDVRPEQVTADLAATAHLSPRPRYLVGDAANHDAEPTDLIVTCPPYWHAEVYSDDPADLSTAPTWEVFAERYAKAISRAAGALRPDRFAVLVVGYARERGGRLRTLAPLTIEAAEDAGLVWHDELVIRQRYGSAAMRAGRQFGGTRRTVRNHSFAEVFVKGSAKVATVRLEVE